MKKYRQNFKLTVLSILAIVAYMFMIGYSLGKEIDDFFIGYDMGKTRAEIDEGVRGNEPMKDVYYLRLKPSRGHLSFPDSIKNLSNNSYVPYRSHYVKARVAFDKASLKKIGVYRAIEIALSVISFILMIYIPILFFKFVFSLMDGVIFDHKNIKRLRRLGYVLLTFYASYFAADWCAAKINKLLFQFENYSISMSGEANFIWVLLGIVVLLCAEILSRGYKLQEEQELTI